MRGRMTMMCRSTLTVVALAAVLAACADDGETSAPDDDQASTRDTGQAYDDEHVMFTVPDPFEQTSPGDELTDGLEVEYLNDPSGEQTVPEQITLGYGIPDSDAFDIAAWPAFAFGGMPGENEKLDEEEVEVEGADEYGIRVTYRFHIDDLNEPLMTTAVGVRVDDHDELLIADLRYAAIESEFDERVADEIMSSLVLR